MTPFRLVLPAASPGAEIEVDGKPVTNAVSVAVKAEVGHVTKLYLELVGDGTIEGEGIVHVVKPGPNVGEWLSHIDPDELEKAALDRMGGLDGGSTGAAMLAVLRGWAGGGA